MKYVKSTNKYIRTNTCALIKQVGDNYYYQMDNVPTGDTEVTLLDIELATGVNNVDITVKNIQGQIDDLTAVIADIIGGVI